MLNAIVAVDANYGIGYNNQLLENIPEDLKNFKQLTTGNVVIMGKKTYDSLPKKPLPNRLNIVITHQEIQPEDKNVIFMTKEKVESWIALHRDIQDVFIIGGSSIYDMFVPICDQVFVTKINAVHENVDSYFINLDNDSHWRGSPISDWREYKDISYQFWIYERI